MPFTIFPGANQFWYPIDRRVLGGSMVRVDLYEVPGEDSVTQIVAAGHIWFKERTGTKTITRIGFTYAGTNGNAGVQNLRVSIRDLHFSGFGPDASEYDAQVVPAADSIGVTWQDLGPMGVTVSFGQELCVVFEPNGGFNPPAAGDKMGIYFFHEVADNAGRGFPWVATFGTDINGVSESQILNMLPALVFEFSDGTFGMFDGSVPIGSTAWNEIGAGEEFGIRFRLPWNVKIDALCYYGRHGGGDGQVNLVLYEGTTELVLREVFGYEVGSTTADRLISVPLQDEQQINANTDYFLVVRQTGTDATVSRFFLNDDGHGLLFGDANLSGVSRSGLSGPWTIHGASTLFRVGVRISSSVAPAALLAANPGSYAITGSPATLTRTRKLVAEAGSYAITGFDTSLEQSTKIILAATGQYAITGFAATLAKHRFLTLNAGTYALTGSSASLIQGARLELAAGSYSLTGFSTTLKKDSFLDLATGTYAISGFAATLLAEGATTYSLELDAGSYALTGSDLGMVADYVLSLASGNYQIIGFPATIFVGAHLELDTGSYALTGSDITALATRVLLLEAGQYLHEGRIADFDIDIPESSACGRASGVLVGMPFRTVLPVPDGSNTAHDRRQAAYQYCADLMPSLVLDAGSYSLTGSDANFIRGYHLELASGVYNAIGMSADLAYRYFLSLAAGSYALTGSDATIEVDRFLSLEAGSYVLTGSDAILDSTATGSFTIILESGSYALTGFDATFNRTYLMTLESGSYEITGFDNDPFVFQAAWVAGKTKLIDEFIEQ